MNYVATLQNSEVAKFGRFLSKGIIGHSICAEKNGCSSEVAAIGRCLLGEILLYNQKF